MKKDMIALITVVLALGLEPAVAKDKLLVKFQKIKKDGGKWVAVGNGPFKDDYATGIPVGKQLRGFSPGLVADMFTEDGKDKFKDKEWKFMSVGNMNGTYAENISKKTVRGIIIKIPKGDYA